MYIFDILHCVFYVRIVINFHSLSSHSLSNNHFVILLLVQQVLFLLKTQVTQIETFRAQTDERDELSQRISILEETLTTLCIECTSLKFCKKKKSLNNLFVHDLSYRSSLNCPDTFLSSAEIMTEESVFNTVLLFNPLSTISLLITSLIFSYPSTSG